MRIFGSRPPKGSAAPDHAWRALTLTNDWIRHADSKIGITTAFIGATGGLLLSTIREVETWTDALQGLSVFTGIALLAALGFAAGGLFPRTTAGRRGAAEVSEAEAEVNLLFFGDVARHYREHRASYRDVLSSMTSDSKELTEQIADQIYVNSKIASTKFFCANWAIRLEVTAAILLAAVVIVETTGV